MLEEERAAKRRIDARRIASDAPIERSGGERQRNLLLGGDLKEVRVTEKLRPRAPMHLADNLNIANEERLMQDFPQFHREGIMRIKMPGGQFLGEKTFDERMATAKKVHTAEQEVRHK